MVSSVFAQKKQLDLMKQLLTSDPSIRALILTIDKANNDIIIMELDDQHLLIDGSKVDYVKSELNRLLDENTYNPEGEL